MSRPRPPRLSRLLVRAIVRGPDAEFVLGDLEEDFERVLAERGAREARRWYRRQAWGNVGAWLARDGKRTGEAWRREARVALRSLGRAPAYSVTSVLTFAIALGGVCTVGTLAYSVLRPLPYPDSDRLVAVWETRRGERRWVAPANYLDWRTEAGSFAGLAAHDTRAVSLTVEGVATRGRVAVVSGNFFDVLGVAPTLGRTFDPTLDTGFAERVAVLSTRAWSEAFGSDPRVVGSTFRVEHVRYQVVGVMPQGVDFPAGDLFAWVRSPTEAPGIAGLDVDVTTLRDAWYFEVLGRLADKVDLRTAAVEMDGLTSRLAELHPDTNQGSGARLVPLLDQTVAGAGSVLAGLALAVGIVLLAACLNVTHLTLARSDARIREVAIKRSLGAGRADVERQSLVEATLLSTGGSALGIAGAALAVDRGGTLLAVLPRPGEIALHPGAATATLAFALCVGLGVGLVTARLGAGAADAMAGPLGRSRAAGRSTRSVRGDLARGGSLRGAMIALQVAGSIALLSATGLMARSVGALASVDLGFRPEGLLTFRVALPDAPTRAYQERVAIYERIADRVEALPGVLEVGLGSDSPLATGRRAGVFLEGRRDVDDPPGAGWQPIDPSYFDAVGMRVFSGRGFTDADGAGTPDVAVVNEAFVRTALDARPALGARVTMGLDGHDRPLTIVGVIEDTRTLGPAEEPFPVLYRPLAQTDRYGAASVLVAVRAAAQGDVGLAALRSTVRRTEPGLPFYAEASGEDLARPFRSAQSTLSAALGAFALTTTLLALVGVYGVTSHGVGRRRREIGVRLALGAEPGSVTTHLLGRGLRTALFGVPLGIAFALALGAVLEGLLFGVVPTDPWTLGVASALVLATVAVAVFLPARAAARTDPAETTRAA